MKRRDFIKIAPLTTAPFLLNGVSIKALNQLPELPPGCDEVKDRVLVLIQMRGGNDGVNTIIPLNQFDRYVELRNDIHIPEADLINLDSGLALEDQVGLHPSMTGFKDLYDQGRLNIVQGVSYTNTNFSHFKATDLWLTGGDGTPENNLKSSGWMARYLSYTYPGGAGNPTNQMPDPLGIQIGQRKPSLGYHSEVEHGISINLAGQDPNGFYNVLNEVGGLPPENIPDGIYGDQIQFVVDEKANAEVYAERLSNVFDAGSNTGTYPSTYLGNQLKTVAKLLSGGCKTKVFLVDITGFDTHVDQVEAGNVTVGRHADLLGQMADAVSAFQNDLVSQSLDDKVLTVTFSEFGRKAAQNDNVGTDHGNFAPMFIIGSGVNPGILGTNMNLDNVDEGNGRFFPTEQQHDYRQVYTTALQDWLGIDSPGLEVVEFEDYETQKVDIINGDDKVPAECYFSSILPVELIFFNAQARDNSFVHLTWATATETNSAYFEIERSSDALSFRTIERIGAAGNSNVRIDYETFDHDPLPGVSYYRLKQVDLDGTIHYFNIEQVEIAGVFKVALYPNPVKYKAYLSITTDSKGSAELSLHSIDGRRIWSTVEDVEIGFTKLEIEVNQLPAGAYILQGRMKDEMDRLFTISEKLIKV